MYYPFVNVDGGEMKQLISVCAAFCVLASPELLAQSKPKAKQNAAESAVWTKEPDAFLGIKFGEPLPSDIRYCQDYSSVKAADSICLRAGAIDGYYEVDNLPTLGFWYSAALRMQHGMPKWFSITASRRDFEQLEAAFFDRYGPPTTKRVATVQTTGGAEFPSKTYSWVGKRVQIDMAERSGSIDKSGVTISDRDVTMLQKQMEQDASKRGAAKF